MEDTADWDYIIEYDDDSEVYKMADVNSYDLEFDYFNWGVSSSNSLARSSKPNSMIIRNWIDSRKFPDWSLDEEENGVSVFSHESGDYSIEVGSDVVVDLGGRLDSRLADLELEGWLRGDRNGDSLEELVDEAGL